MFGEEQVKINQTKNLILNQTNQGQFSCRKNISRMAVCDTDQKEITIDETYCWSVDQLGRPIDIYSDVDYRMQVCCTADKFS